MPVKKIILMSFLLLSCLSVRAEGGRFRLFTEEAKCGRYAAVYNFLETYLFKLDSLQRCGQLDHKQLFRDKILFLKGTPATARKLTPTTSFALNIHNGRTYEGIWTDSLDKVLLQVAFPANFELILGQPKNKLEHTMEAQLRSMPKTFKVEEIDSGIQLNRLEDGFWERNPKEIYEINKISDAIYFEKLENDSLRPVFSSDQKWYSASNLLQGVISQADKYKLYIVQSVYAFDYLKYTVRLSQWLNYCRSIHANVYLGLEEEREDGLKVLLLAQNMDLGYKHILSIVVPWNFVDSPSVALKANMNAYIPIHNVKSYYKEKNGKKKRIR